MEGEYHSEYIKAREQVLKMARDTFQRYAERGGTKMLWMLMVALLRHSKMDKNTQFWEFKSLFTRLAKEAKPTA